MNIELESHNLTRKLVTELGFLKPEEIFNKFKQEGITGDVFSAQSCPLTNYLNRNNSSIKHASWKNICYVDDFSDEVKLMETPESVFVFLERFDHGNYPELENKQ